MPFIYATTIALFATFGSTALAETISGTASVIDDDTFEIHGERIRLNAIDAIKSGQQCFLPEGKVWSCGQDAAFALSDKIGRRTLECRVKDIDRYGRWVSVCTLGGEDIGAWMVENGWAVAYRRYGKAYVAAEDRARRGSLGIWASTFEMPWVWRKAHP